MSGLVLAQPAWFFQPFLFLLPFSTLTIPLLSPPFPLLPDSLDSSPLDRVLHPPETFGKYSNLVGFSVLVCELRS